MPTSSQQFNDAIINGYTFKEATMLLGSAMFEARPIDGLQVKVPLKTLNRHGLISGATGSGKTKTLQMIAEGLSKEGVPCLLMDIKGDLSGLAAQGTLNEKISTRHSHIGCEWKPEAFPVDFFSISNEPGVRLRATVSEFGPVLFSKILELNDTQSGVVSLIFKYCDDNGLLLLDLKDFKKVLQYLTNEGKDKIAAEYGRISSSTASTILRKIIEIEEQDAEKFFGELSFDVNDLTRMDEKGRGILNLIRLADMQGKPKMFSTFVLCLLAEIYASFPELGDPERPELMVFIDEAHLLFKDASKALLEQIETIIRLIRSKGIGVVFITQNPSDIPASVLGQLGFKIQHSFRAFTANDRKDLRLIARNYPETDFYQVEELLTSLGIGEALVTVLNEKGIPTPLVHTLLCAPRSRMDVLNSSELNNAVESSALYDKYNKEIDRESAYEILSRKIENVNSETTAKDSPVSEPHETILGKVVDSTAGRQIMRVVARELTRGLLGVLGINTTGRKTRKRGSLFG